MAVYVDDFFKTGKLALLGTMKMSHVIADSSAELISMMNKIHLSKKHLQCKGTPKEHFDVCLANRAKVIACGGVPIGYRELANVIKLRKQVRLLDKSFNEKITKTL